MCYDSNISNLRIRPFSFRDLRGAADTIGFDVLFQPECIHLAIALLTSDLPEGWGKHWDQEHNAYYFYNSNTEEVVWDHPMLQTFIDQYHEKATNDKIVMASREKVRESLLSNRGDAAKTHPHVETHERVPVENANAPFYRPEGIFVFDSFFL